MNKNNELVKLLDGIKRDFSHENYLEDFVENFSDYMIKKTLGFHFVVSNYIFTETSFNFGLWLGKYFVETSCQADDDAKIDNDYVTLRRYIATLYVCYAREPFAESIPELIQFEDDMYRIMGEYLHSKFPEIH